MRTARVGVLTAVLVGVAGAAQAGDWPQWRGPNRSGITSEASNHAGGRQPKRLWEKRVGKGCTSPIMAQGRLYVMGWEGSEKSGTDSVWCLEARTGKDLWRRTYPSPYQGRVHTGDEGQYGGPSSTPTFDAETAWLYTLSVDGHLACWDTADGGEPVWRLNLYDAYKVPQRPDVGGGRRDYGFTSSPLILGDLVVVEVGERAGTVMAFDKKTGARRWRSECAEPAGHTGGPAPISLNGVPCLATLALRKLVILRMDPGHEGKTIAEYPWQTDFGCNIATPAVAEGAVLLTSDYNVSRTALLEISGAGVRQRWTARAHSMVSSPVIHKGRVYFANGRLTCLDLGTGRTIWSGGSFGHGSCLVTGDDKIFAFGKGNLVLVDAAPTQTEYRELARVEKVVGGTCYPHVALSDGIVACKDRDGALVCFAVGDPAAK